ncbi:unnamed protein product [Ceratitis capitata]|uniref:(Mediterranean fruit fly) hypothetical protein n=1 Tax=Ceratitis capitata TaxID=7213 RepID=A0A811VIM7_CERCA|nr:unnamed protein product [Ceratitis capitata]
MTSVAKECREPVELFFASRQRGLRKESGIQSKNRKEIAFDLRELKLHLKFHHVHNWFISSYRWRFMAFRPYVSLCQIDTNSNCVKYQDEPSRITLSKGGVIVSLSDCTLQQRQTRKTFSNHFAVK